MGAFTRQELRELDPADLRGLLELADGETDLQRAMALGLDPSHPKDRLAVFTAMETAAEDVPTPFSQVIGTDADAVRLNRTADEREPAAPVDGQGGGTSAALMAAEGSLAAATDIRAAMQESAVTGSPMFAGTFALYATPKGEVVLVTEDPAGDVKRSVVPRQAVKMALALIAGERTGLAGLVARKFGRG